MKDINIPISLIIKQTFHQTKKTINELVKANEHYITRRIKNLVFKIYLQKSL